MNLKQPDTLVDAFAETPRDAGSIPAASILNNRLRMSQAVIFIALTSILLGQLSVPNSLMVGVAEAAAVKTPTGEVLPVTGTNNEAERTLRGAAQARKTGRTNKTQRGARRQTVLTSVLESLRRQLACFTLSSVLEEISRTHTSPVASTSHGRRMQTSPGRITVITVLRLGKTAALPNAGR
jgi:hypothetical protein